MNKTSLITTVILLIAVCASLHAATPPDVPVDHWAYRAVEMLIDTGIIQGYPDGTFGGKRALTRYEFAEAVSKILPIVEDASRPSIMAGCIPPPPPPLVHEVTAEQFEAIKKLAIEFRDELAALGVDVDDLQQSLSTLEERITALEESRDRINFFGEFVVSGRGEVAYAGQYDAPIDRDGRELAASTGSSNPLENSSFTSDLQFGMKAKVGENVTVNGLYATNNYLRWALDDSNLDDFILWNANMQADVQLGFLGSGDLTAGRFSHRLTPLTLMFTDPDSYTDVSKLDSGDYVLDGGKATLNYGDLSVTGFAAKGDAITQKAAPCLMTGSGYSVVSHLGGARAAIDTPWNGVFGMTYYTAGIGPAYGREQVYGADLSSSFGSIGVYGEWAETKPSDLMDTTVAGVDYIDPGDGTYTATSIGTENNAWNANLTWQSGSLALGGGYGAVGANYSAPGSWSRYGRAVNLRNVKGYSANASLALSPELSISAEGQWLEPNRSDYVITGRTAIDPGGYVRLENSTYLGDAVDRINYYRGGIKYGITSKNTLDLGWEEVQWSPVSGSDTSERYLTVGVGHEFNPNASLRLLYQVVEYRQGSLSPYESSSAYQGGIASAQFVTRY